MQNLHVNYGINLNILLNDHVQRSLFVDTEDNFNL